MMMLCGYLQLTAPEFTVTFCSTVFIFYVITLAALFFFLGITWFCVFLEYSELIMFTSHIMLKVFRCWYFHTHINIRWGYEKDILTVASLTRSMSVDILQLLYNIVWKNAFEDACSRWMTFRAALTGKHDTLVRKAPGWQGAPDGQQAKKLVVTECLFYCKINIL